MGKEESLASCIEKASEIAFNSIPEYVSDYVWGRYFEPE